MKKILISVLAFLIFLSGCAQNVRPTSTKTFTGQERVFNKNYNKAIKQAAFVGEPVVKVKDYKVKKYKSKYMTPDTDFITRGGPVEIIGKASEKYEIDGEVTIDGINYTVVSFPRYDGKFGVLVDGTGKVSKDVLNSTYGARNIKMIYDFVTTPSDVRLNAVENSEIDVKSGYLNYELIYGGTDGKSITLTYREYTSEDLARAAFFQNLVYEKGTERIRFKDTVIKVYEATSEKIVYEVLSDNLK